MGGNALKSVETVRLSREDYEVLSQEVLAKLQSLPELSGRKISIIQAYRTKESFGDLDVLVESVDGSSVDYLALITKAFQPKEIAQNSSCYSFDIRNFQVDFILTPTDDYETSVNYFAWNDLGNLTGRIFKKLGFKYGHRGLSYIFRDEGNANNSYHEAVVSKDLKAILEFGDLDYDAFVKGFDTVEEIFYWVSKSKYFHKDIYLLHNRNHVSRTRDKKRKTYKEFLVWCEETPGLNTYPWTIMREQDGYAGSPEFLKDALVRFPSFYKVYHEVKNMHENILKAKDKFNGEVVKEAILLEGSNLGKFMASIMKSVGGKQAMSMKVLGMSSEEIHQMIVEHFTTDFNSVTQNSGDEAHQKSYKIRP